jgi:hypothetical protein
MSNSHCAPYSNIILSAYLPMILMNDERLITVLGQKHNSTDTIPGTKNLLRLILLYIYCTVRLPGPVVIKKLLSHFSI